MRWGELFADLEGQLEAAEAAGLASEVADRTRREAAQVSLVDRLLPAVGARVRLRALGAGAIEGVLAEVGSDWLLVAEASGQEALVPRAAVLWLAGLGAHSSVPGSAGRVFERLGLAAALRGIARDRAPVTVWLVDGSTLSGTVDRVGADVLELRSHAAGETAPRGERLPVRAVPLAAVGVVRRAG